MTAFVESWTRELTQALEMMTGQPFRSSTPVLGGAATCGCLWWNQSLSAAAGISLAIGAAAEVWNELGTRALLGAGIESVDESEARSTWFEIIQQSISGAVRKLTVPSGGTVECTEGHAGDTPPVGRVYDVDLTTPDGMTLRVQMVLSEALLASLGVGKPNPETATQAPRASTPSVPVAPASRTMEVLLDVHLPVSISFGSAEMPLRDVLKLSAGSVVELDRQPEEPVDLIVNGCVIARGEVVVVDGNYGVRVQEIVSRKERLDVSRVSHSGR